MSQKTAEILQKLEQGVRDLQNSDNYKQYLQFLTTFRNYSFRNTLLIFSQFPSATLIAPYREWQKRHRHVRKGERGINIIAPHTYKSKNQSTDEETEKLGFHIAKTFDVSQTDPDNEQGEIPEICHRLTGGLADADLLDILVSISPVPVTFQPIQGGANGYYSKSTLEIVVDNDNDPLQQVKTLLHEQAHVRHDMLDPDFDVCSKEDKEVIAESAAYTVCNYLGIDTSSYSFGYLAGWGSKDMKELTHNLDLIKKISDATISEIENYYEKDNSPSLLA